MKRDSLAHGFGGGKVLAAGRPPLPRAVRSAIVEWVMAALGGYFLVAYFVILPRSDAQVYGPWDLALMLPLVLIAGAALRPLGAVWARSTRSEARDRRRARLAVLVLAVPPLIDIACRLAGLQPALAGQRTELTLACCAMLSLLVALRVRQASRPPAARDAEAAEVRTSVGEPSEYLQFASGVAHELNNPLMAVAGWAELAVRRGAPEPELRALVDATARTADAVARLQLLVRSGRGPDTTR
jgi:signal transduction histidine kinase